MKQTDRITGLLLIIVIPFIFLTASICWAVNSQWLYTSGFEKYNVSQVTGLPESELDMIATEFIRYFNSSEEFITINVDSNGDSFSLFTEEEAIHFKDVKGLFRLDYWVLIGTFSYFLVYTLVTVIRRKPGYLHRLARNTLYGSILTIALIVILGLLSFLDFDRLFLQFHLLSFSNEFWSAEGYMLLLFPRGFWIDIIIYCGLFMTGLATVFGGIGAGYLIIQQRKEISGVSKRSREDR